MVTLLSLKPLAASSGSSGLRYADTADGASQEHGMAKRRVPGREGGRGLGAGRTPAETGSDHALASEERPSSASPQHERR